MVSRPLIAFLLLVALLHLLVVSVGVGPEPGRVVLANSLYLAMIAGSALLVVRAWLAERRRGREGLEGYALGMVALLLAEAWMLQYDRPGASEAPDFSVADPLYFLSYLGMAYTLLRFNGLRVWGLAAAVLLLDSLIGVVVVGEIAWITFLHDLLNTPGVTVLSRTVNLTYVFLDLLVLGLTLLALRRRLTPPLLLLGLGILAFVSADLMYFAQVIAGSYKAGTPLDALWSWGTAAQATGLVWAWREHRSLPAEKSQLAFEVPAQDRTLLVLPFLAMMVGGLLLAFMNWPPLAGKHVERWAVALFAVVMLRQALAALERERLNEQLRLQARELHHLAFHDALTGLANRAAFEQTLHRRLGDSRRAGLALLYIDLDDFKPINDALGHAAGDLALQVVARRLQAALPPDTFAARLGGDEFIVLLDPAPTADAAAEVAGQLAAALRLPMTLGSHSAQVTASVGVEYVPVDDTRQADDLWRDADHAMYRVKHHRDDLA